jgi:ATP-dependent Clp protease, protease subunit
MSAEHTHLNDIIGSKLLDDRKVFLWGQVDDDSAKEVINRMLYLDLTDPGKEISFIINSPGGYVTSGFAIYDTIKSLKSPVATYCLGFAASMGSVLLSAGAKGRRFILPNARVMIHQPSGGAQGTSTDIEIQVRELLKTKELLSKILAENCNRPIEKVAEDLDRDYWMSASESVEYGIVDKEVQSY